MAHDVAGHAELGERAAAPRRPRGRRRPAAGSTAPTSRTRRRARRGRAGSRGCRACRTSSGRTARPGRSRSRARRAARRSSPTSLRCARTCALAALVADEAEAHRLEVEARAGGAGTSCSARDFTRSSAVRLLARGERERGLRRVGHARDRRRAPRSRRSPASRRGPPTRWGRGSRGSCAARARRCTCTVASVMMPSRPSLPSTISRTLGPVDVAGTGRITSMPCGVTTRSPRVRSATSPYLSDCMPDERVAIQPPSVEWVKLSGKWPSVQPRALSCSSSRGPKAPAWTRARRDVSSIASTRSSRAMSTETTGRCSSAGASRLPEMFEPPPNGITTASASSAAAMTASTAASSPGRTTTSGSRPRSPRRWRTRSLQALAAGVDDALERLGRHVLGADRRLQRRAQAVRAGAASGSVELAERDRARRRALDVDRQMALEERPERGLVRMRECDVLVAPTPPLHPATLRDGVAG